MEYLEKMIQMFPNASCELTYRNSFEFLCKVILSQQTTDKAVNFYTTDFFAVYDNPFKLKELSYDFIYNKIEKLGLAKNKTNFLLKTSEILANKYDGKIPETREELEKLPGVGRKTANVYMAEILKVPTIAVDTHVYRVTKRLGLTDQKASLLECEQDLMKRYPKELWIKVHHTFLFMGRYKCKAIKPMCNDCLLQGKCKFFSKK